MCDLGYLIEYAEVIERRYSIIDAEYILEQILLRPNLIQSTRYFEWNVMENDPDDNKFFDCAVATGADYIVTEDRHFNMLKHISFPSVSAVKVSEFKKILDSLTGI